MTNTKFTRTETPGGGWVIRCNECRGKAGASPAFPRSEQDVRHSPVCSLSVAAVAAPVTVTAQQARIASEGGISHSGLTESEIVEAVSAGKISASDALNRDY